MYWRGDNRTRSFAVYRSTDLNAFLALGIAEPPILAGTRELEGDGMRSGSCQVAFSAWFVDLAPGLYA